MNNEGSHHLSPAKPKPPVYQEAQEQDYLEIVIKDDFMVYERLNELKASRFDKSKPSLNMQPSIIQKQLKPEPAANDKTLIAQENWFSLRKFEPKSSKLQKSEQEMKMTKKMHEVLQKLSIENKNIMDLDLEKALMLANLAGSQHLSAQFSALRKGGTEANTINSPDTEHFYSCYIQGMKRHCKTRRIFKHCMKRIEEELDKTDNKRVEVKRALIKFTKENMSGFKLEQPNLLKMD